MQRAYREAENLTFETPAKLKQASVLVALQRSYESYEPKTRVVLLEAAAAAAGGLSPRDALATLTIPAPLAADTEFDQRRVPPIRSPASAHGTNRAR